MNAIRILPIVLGLLIAGLPGVARAEKKIAFVIGNGAYLHASRLPNPANDAKAMSQALEKLGSKVVTGHDAGQARGGRAAPSLEHMDYVASWFSRRSHARLRP